MKISLSLSDNRRIWIKTCVFELGRGLRALIAPLGATPVFLPLKEKKRRFCSPREEFHLFLLDAPFSIRSFLSVPL